MRGQTKRDAIIISRLLGGVSKAGDARGGEAARDGRSIHLRFVCRPLRRARSLRATAISRCHRGDFREDLTDALLRISNNRHLIGHVQIVSRGLVSRLSNEIITFSVTVARDTWRRSSRARRAGNLAIGSRPDRDELFRASSLGAGMREGRTRYSGLLFAPFIARINILSRCLMFNFI